MIGAEPQVKLWQRIMTSESRTGSPASAIAILMWFVPGWIVPVAKNTWVRPSSSVLMEPPPSLRSLFR